MTKLLKIAYLETAKSDFEEIFAYITKDNLEFAIDLLDNIDHSISNLARFPEIGLQPKDARIKALGYRILIVENYLIFYIRLNQVIEIHRIFHGSQDHYNFL